MLSVPSNAVHTQSLKYSSRVIFRDRQWTDLQGGPGRGVNLGGSSGSTDNPTSKKFHFCIIQTMLNTISQNNFEKKTLIYGTTPTPLLANPGYILYVFVCASGTSLSTPLCRPYPGWLHILWDS